MRRAATTVLLACLLAGCGSKHHATSSADVHASIDATVQACDAGETGSLDRATACYERHLLTLVDDGGAPATELPQIDAAVRASGGFLLGDCHLLMHWVGRNYAVEHGVTLGTLQDFLPRSNDPGCSAGFAHGLISALGKSIAHLEPSAVAATCAKAPTRYQQYSCVHGLGHAYMRAYVEDLPLALRMCGRLPRVDVVDCAQGAFHDYWFAEEGADNLISSVAPLTPRELCGRQQPRFVRACWYRAYLESPPDQAINTPHDLVVVCSGLRGLQLQGCITGASVTFDNARPRLQLSGCATLAASLRVSCARGVATQDVATAPTATQVALVTACDAFGAERPGCVEWVAKALNVDTNGTFMNEGCRRVPTLDRAPCRTGAATWRGPLETFS